MKINKSKSKTIAKLVSLSLASSMLFSNVDVEAEGIDILVQKQLEFHHQQDELVEMIKRLGKDEYDAAYNDFCDNESITINDKEYFIKDLYIEYGYIGDMKKVYLKDYHNSDVDIITGNITIKDYSRRKVILLKFSDVFYEYYYSDDKDLAKYINMFDGNINYSVPETYFLREGKIK